MLAMDNRDFIIAIHTAAVSLCGMISLGWFLDVRDVVMMGAGHHETAGRRPAE